MFAQTRPKLAAFTHLVMLASETIAEPTVEQLIAATRETYAGPLEVREDLTSFEIGETVTVHRPKTANGCSTPCQAWSKAACEEGLVLAVDSTGRRNTPIFWQRWGVDMKQRSRIYYSAVQRSRHVG